MEALVYIEYGRGVVTDCPSPTRYLLAKIIEIEMTRYVETTLTTFNVWTAMAAGCNIRHCAHPPVVVAG